MPALNFQKRFAPSIINGEKRQTIRFERKRPIKVNNKLYLYTGMRTKYCTKLEEVICRVVTKVIINEFNVWVGDETIIKDIIGLNYFAQQDGFKDWPEMLEWFERYGLPFEGVLIEW